VRELEGKCVVITGGSSGIGAATAHAFAKRGATLALIARSPSGLEKVARAVRAEGAEAHVLVADVADRAQAAQAIAAAAHAMGRIDILVSNAAAAVYGPFTEIAADDFDRTVAITFTGAVNVIRAALLELERAHGTLIAVGSTVARTPTPMQSPYSAAKGALRGFLGALRVELKAQRSSIKVCMVHPAPIDTPFWAHATSTRKTSPKPLRSAYAPETVAEAILATARKPRREVSVGGSGLGMNLLGTLARPLADLALASYGIRGQRDDRPAPTPGSLWQPSGTGATTAGYRGRRSVFTALRLGRKPPL
jgi:short-subunit dehydrogenase